VIFSQMNETQDVVYSLHKRGLNHIRCWHDSCWPLQW
jgi:hypothetical protein